MIKKAWIMAVAIVLLASMAQAEERMYMQSGDWTYGGRWKNGVMPVTGDAVKYIQAGTLTVSTDVNTKDTRFARITLGNSGGNATLTVDGQLFATELYVGHWLNYTGTVNVNSGRLDVQGGETHIGQYATGTGILNINGGTFHADDLHVGFEGSTGVVNQAGGSVWADNLILGSAIAGGSAAYNLSGGKLILFQADSRIRTAGGTSALNFVGDGVLEWTGNRGADLDALIAAGTIAWTHGQTAMLTEDYERSWTNGNHVLYADTDGTLVPGQTTVWVRDTREPIDAMATTETRNLFRNLSVTAASGTIFGAQTTTSMGKAGGGWRSTAASPLQSDVKTATGDYPGVFGFDFKKWSFDLDNGWLTDLEQVKEIYRRGGVVTFSWHTDNPVTGGNSKDTAGDPLTAILPGGTRNALFNSWLDEIADFAHQAEVDGVKVPIIFRPFHENTGTWFWWGSQNSSATYIEAFRYTVDYLKDVKGVHNFLYAFSPNQTPSDSAYLETYPGDNYIDILGFDHYFNSNATPAQAEAKLFQNLGRITALAEQKGKIAAFTEVGCIKGIQNADSNTWFTDMVLEPMKSVPGDVAYCMTWHNRYEPGQPYWVPLAGDPNYTDFLAYYQDSSTLFLSDLPDMYSRTQPGFGEEMLWDTFTYAPTGALANTDALWTETDPFGQLYTARRMEVMDDVSDLFSLGVSNRMLYFLNTRTDRDVCFSSDHISSSKLLQINFDFYEPSGTDGQLSVIVGDGSSINAVNVFSLSDGTVSGSGSYTLDAAHHVKALFNESGEPLEYYNPVGGLSTLGSGLMDVWIDDTLAVSNASNRRAVSPVSAITGVKFSADGKPQEIYLDNIAIAKMVPAPEPVDPQATPNTRALLNYLHGLRYNGNTGRVLSGTSLSRDLAQGYEVYVEETFRQTGVYPAILQPLTNLHWTKRGNPDSFPYAQHRSSSWLVPNSYNWAKAGGVVFWTFNPDSPFDSLTHRTSIPEGHHISEVWTPGTEAYDVWRENLTALGLQLKRLEVYDIPVVVHMIEEADNTKEQWTNPNTNNHDWEDFRRLWRYTVDFIRDEMDVHNVLWNLELTGSNIPEAWQEDYIDIAGLQETVQEGPYTQPHDPYIDFEDIQTTKPLIYGQYLVKDFKDNAPSYDYTWATGLYREHEILLTGSIPWDGKTDGATPSMTHGPIHHFHGQAYYDDPVMLNRGDNPAYGNCTDPEKVSTYGAPSGALSTNGLVYNFNEDLDAEGWATENVISDPYPAIVNSNAFHIYYHGQDPILKFDGFNRNAGPIGSAVLRIRNNSLSEHIVFEWQSTAGPGWHSVTSAVSRLPEHYEVLTFDLAASPDWNGTITQVRFRLNTDYKWGSSEIDYIAFVYSGEEILHFENTENPEQVSARAYDVEEDEVKGWAFSSVTPLYNGTLPDKQVYGGAMVHYSASHAANNMVNDLSTIYPSVRFRPWNNGVTQDFSSYGVILWDRSSFSGSFVDRDLQFTPETVLQATIPERSDALDDFRFVVRDGAAFFVSEPVAPSGRVYQISDPNALQWASFALVEGATNYLLNSANVGTYGAKTFSEVGQVGFAFTHSKSSTKYAEASCSDFLFLGAQLASTNTYAQWLERYPELGIQTNAMDNPDGDRMNNFAEYAFGGDPAVADDAGILPGFTKIPDGFHYVYRQRSDWAALGLTYTLQSRTNLLFGTWETNRYEFYGTGPIDPEFDAVTNHIPTDAYAECFFRVRVGQE